MNTLLNRLAIRVHALRPARTARRLIAAAAVAVCLSVAAPSAHAQFGLGMMGGEMGDMLKPSTNARLLKQYAEILTLSPEQKRAADELLGAYQAEFRDAVGRLEEIYQSIQEEIQDSGEWELYQTAIPAVMVKFVKRTETLNSTFMTDLKALLDQQQLARFDEVERYHRRKAAIKVGLEGAQKIDLFDTIQGLRIDPGAASAANASLEQYAMELDKELVDRDRSIRSFLNDMAKFMEDGKTPQEDPEMMMKWMKEMGESAKRIEGVNLKYVPILRAALPEPAQAEFDLAIKQAKYPSIYKKSFATRLFDAIDKMTDLDAGQKDGIKTIKESYERDAAAANDRWAAVLDELKNNLPEEQRMMGGGMWMINQDQKYTEARDARKAIDEKAIESAKAILSDAQRAKLPKKNFRPEWDFDRAPTH